MGQKKGCDDCGGDLFKVVQEFEFLDTLSGETCLKLRELGWEPEKGNPIDYIDEYGDTLLHSAARLGLVEVLKELLAMNSDVDACCQSECCCTPLMVACRWCNADCARLLLERGADIEQVNSFGETPLEQATSRAMGSEQDKVRVIALLRNRAETGGAITYFDEYGDSLLHTAARSGVPDVLKELLDMKAEANVQCQGECCCSPLMVACRWCNVDCARVLLEHGADTNQVNSHGETATDQATYMAMGSEQDKALTLALLGTAKL